MRKPLDPTALQNSRGAYLAVEAALEAGLADRYALFELRVDNLPEGDAYGVVAGTGRAVQHLQTFLIDEPTLDYLATFLKQETIEYLAELRFRGSVHGLKEGDYYLAHTPVLTIECTYAVGLLLGSFLRSIFNFDSAAATAAHLLRGSQRGRLLYSVNMGTLHEAVGEDFARACNVVGFEASDSTAALKANADMNAFGGLPKALTQALGSEQANRDLLQATFDDQLTMPLLSTSAAELRDEASAALATFGEGLFAVSLGAFEQLRHAKALRRHLDKLEASATNIIFVGSLTPEQLAYLTPEIPVDSLALDPETIYGARPRTAGFGFELVAMQDETYGEFRPIPADAPGGGRKVIYREHGDDWKLKQEILVSDPQQPIQSHWARPGIIYVQNGKLVFLPTLEQVRDTAADLLTTAPDSPVETLWLPDFTADTQEDTTTEVTED
jgi:nicotinate phosphoribosyltransferase